MSPSSITPLRILHIHQRAAFMGGVEQILYDTAKSLAEVGWPQALLHGGAIPENAAFIQPFEMVGVDSTIIERFQPDVLLLHKVADEAQVALFATLKPAVRMVHDHDLVCMRSHKYFPIGTKICDKPAGINCYTHLCFVQKSPAGSTLPIRFESVSAQLKIIQGNKKLRAFIVGSHWMQEELVMNGIGAAHIHIVHPIPRALAKCAVLPPSGRREILFVGQVIRGKGVDLLLQALAQLKGEWQARIVGQGNHLDYCKALALKLRIADKIEFTGWVDHENLTRYYANALFTAVPSRWPEPFGMVGVEAMARGRPVVGFRAGGIPDWLEHEVTGLIADEADVNGLAHQMQHLLDDTEFAAKLGRNAAQSVQQHFSHATYIQKMMQVLGGLL